MGGNGFLTVAPLGQLAVGRETILPPAAADLPNCLIGDNFDQLPDPVLSQARAQIYKARSVQTPSVDLVRYPEGARLFGGHHFLVECGGLLADNQLPPNGVLLDADSIARLAAEPLDRVAVHDPCVLVARFGIRVWGHWVGELLPRLLLAERAFPGRFRYVLPAQVFNSSAPRNIWNSLWDTIRMAGIDKRRILPVFATQHYVFSELHAVTSVISSAGFHPAALVALRAAYLGPGERRADRKVAILRTESTGRNIANLIETIPLLRARDYEFVEIGTLPFQEQVYLFSTARIVVGVLASGLTGLFFSPDRVRVLSVGPEGYVNGFFYAIMQSRDAAFVDVRGRATPRESKSSIFWDFHVDLADFGRGLDCLEAGEGQA